jgi:hypothetical protein
MKKCWYKEMAVYQVWPRSFCDGDGDGTYELYFTFFANGRGGVTAYLPTEGKTELLLETDRLIGAFESLDGRSVEFYYAEQLESDRYLNLLHRSEKIIIQKESKE